MIKDIINMYKRYRNEANVLIYQMGKVGSSSLEHSIPGAINVHTLFANSPCPPHFKNQSRGLKGWLRHSLPFVFKRIALRRRNVLKIITLVREPVSRNRSMFFQDLYHWLADYVVSAKASAKTEGLELLQACYEEHFNHDYFDSWFNNEIKKLTGVDVFKYPYHPGSPCIIREKRCEILVIRLEDLAANIDKVEEFLGHNLSHVDTNVGERKWYAPVYKSFVTQTPLFEVERLLSQSVTSRHFGYSRDDQ